MNQPARILFLNSTFPPHTLGGGPRIAGWIVEGLRARGHPLAVLCAKVDLAETDTGVHRILVPQGDWERGRAADVFHRLLQCAMYRVDQSRSLRLFRSFRPDVLLASSLYNISHAPWTLAEEKGIPRVFFPVASYSPEQLFRPWGRLERLFFPTTGWSPRAPDPTRLGGLAAPSRFLLDDYLAHGIRGKIRRVIPLGIPTNSFTPPRGGPPAGPPWRILWLSRVTREKGIEVALDAFTRLISLSREEIRLTLAGFAHPNAEKWLQDAIRARGLGDRIDRVHIPLGDDDGLIACYRSHHLFWLTSLIPEALSLTLLESLSCGLPVLSSRTGGNTEVIDRCDGALGLPPGDPDAFSAATLRLVDDPARRGEMGRSGRRYVETHHSLEGMAMAFSDFLTAARDLPA